MDKTEIYDLTGAKISFEEIRARGEERLKSGGDGGNSGDMEVRIAKLESDMGHVKETMTEVKGKLGSIDDRLRGVETTLATLTERVAHLPSKEYMFRTALFIVTAVGAFSLFGGHLRTILGLN